MNSATLRERIEVGHRAEVTKVVEELFRALAEVSAMIREASMSKERTRRTLLLIATTSAAVIVVVLGVILVAWQLA